MMRYGTSYTSGQLAILPPEYKEVVEEIVESIFDVETEEGLRIIEFLLDNPPDDLGIPPDLLDTTLKSCGDFMAASHSISTEGDYSKSSLLFQSAAQGFAEIGIQEFNIISTGMYLYAMGVTELSRSNLPRGVEFMNEAEKYLRQAGRYGRQFDNMIAHLKPDIIYATGIQAAQALDFTTAETLIEQAVQAAKQLARKYYNEEEGNYYFFIGMAALYRAQYGFVRAVYDFNKFQYDDLAVRHELPQYAVTASEYLTKDPDNENAMHRNALALAHCLTYLLEAIIDLSSVMQRVLSTDFKPDQPTLAVIKQKLRSAGAAGLGALQQVATAFTKECDRLYALVENLDRLTQPAPPPARELSPFQNVQLAELETSYACLIEEYQANSQQANRTLGAAERVILARRMKELEKEIAVMEDQIKLLRGY